MHTNTHFAAYVVTLLCTKLIKTIILVGPGGGGEIISFNQFPSFFNQFSSIIQESNEQYRGTRSASWKLYLFAVY